MSCIRIYFSGYLDETCFLDVFGMLTLLVSRQISKSWILHSCASICAIVHMYVHITICSSFVIQHVTSEANLRIGDLNIHTLFIFQVPLQIKLDINVMNIYMSQPCAPPNGKYSKFVNEPIFNKSVRDVPGIGDVYGACLERNGYRLVSEHAIFTGIVFRRKQICWNGII